MLRCHGFLVQGLAAGQHLHQGMPRRPLGVVGGGTLIPKALNLSV